jgi:hypothetical protein
MSEAPDQDDWAKVAGALRDLHRTLLEQARLDYEQAHSTTLNGPRFLELLASDAFFAWLRPLSELIVDVDVVRESAAAHRTEMADALRPAVEHLLAPPATGRDTPFTVNYWRLLHADPHVAIAHAAVRMAIRSWPMPAEMDTAAQLHERHRLAEKARHLPFGRK